MLANRGRTTQDIDPKGIEIQFSPEVSRAFGNLEAAVQSSEHFDGDVRSILQQWAAGKKQTLHEVVVAFPLVAEETFRYIRATGDQRAEDAWREICTQLPEKGFMAGMARQNSRS